MRSSLLTPQKRNELQIIRHKHHHHDGSNSIIPLSSTQHPSTPLSQSPPTPTLYLYSSSFPPALFSSQLYPFSSPTSEIPPATMSSGQTFTLSNGVKIPGVGFGTFASEGAVGETYKAVTVALQTGYRHLDCAWYYLNEQEVGDALRDFLKANPSVKREDIFICTKVWNHLHRPEDVKWSLNNSLERFGLDYIDLFLVHWPIAAEKETQEKPKIGADGKYVILKDLTENPEPTWRAVEELYKEGKARAIGVSNWTIPDLEKLFKFAEIKPHVNQIEIHPFLPNTELIDYCFKHDILPAAYSPLGSQNQVPTTGERVSENQTLNDVAKKGGNTLAQVLIAWGLRRGYVVLPKSSNPARIESNFKTIELSDEDFEAVNKVAEGRHFRFVNMKDTFGYDVWPEETAKNLSA
ncbi:glycerol dehydrogenase [Aspergillus sclerotioniger CBS 115572]|uniref:D-xylose reductase [NAD(P)H] n=1 Tax=Aspergillus sclerotioniger CBS 115572 TaxID=1450535 RepID=A0A317XEJ8_9EURO|nr:glycerol dehydrogenase [Aspergillus sclerotioniger CBS 115572]PWY95020.1 glycerol dehydrogenase [Aspergillus sclerotioniger CBS 115572]